MNWFDYGFYITPDSYPHEELQFDKITWGGRQLIAKWTEDFDCNEETQFWWVIMDRPFDLSKLKAKRRYEVNKGNRNFHVKVIAPETYRKELYDVYLESMNGYEHPSIVSKESFDKRIEGWKSNEKCVLFGVFSRADDRLCGYSDVYVNGRYIPISSFKTRVSCEKDNVNFALVYGIIGYFTDEIKNGAYLCDGSRNALHETNFQDFLIKYFGFRKAYCRLRLQYRGAMKGIIPILFLFRKRIRRIPAAKKLSAVLTLHAWSKGVEA